MTRLATVLSVLVVLASPPAIAAQRGTIEVTGSVSHENVAHLPPNGRGGDAYSSYWVIRDRTGHAVGDMVMSCRWVTGNLRLCVSQLTMPMGTVALIGASRTALIGQFAIVGGTGEYAEANGTVLFKAVSVKRYVLTATYKQP